MSEKMSEATVKNVLRKMFYTAHLNFIGFNFVKMQANGFSVALSPAIEEIYKDDEEGRIAAYVRHQEFFNSHTLGHAFILGLTFALERQNEESENFNVGMINDIKVSLMGPTAGIGDSLMFNGLRIIAAGVAIGLASQGSILGPILFVLLYGVVQSILRYYLLHWGYSSGTSFIDQIFGSGLMGSVSKAASILGLMMTGALTAQLVNFPLHWTITSNGAELVVQDVLNNVFPGLLSILYVFVLYWLLKKGIRPQWIIVGLIVMAFVFAGIGIF